MLYLCYLCRFKPLRDHLREFLIAAWAGDKIAEFSFPEISFHFPLRPWFFFVSPAYAGKSPAAAYACPGTQDHPRVCGEKGWDYDAFLYQLGSPPRMRGKAWLWLCPTCPHGITPAYAGKSRPCSGLQAAAKDHPRVCGEKTALFLRFRSWEGSPPRMRGKGSTCCRWRSGRRDHPRVCGEKQAKKSGSKKWAGSPPRMRGKVKDCDKFRENTRITPAYAGKSMQRDCPLVRMEDHPRVCGEKVILR